MLLCDTGVLLAAGNVKDQAHQTCLRLLRQAEGPLLVPSPVLGEIGYLLQSRVGPHAEATGRLVSGGQGEQEVLTAEVAAYQLWSVEAGGHGRLRRARTGSTPAGAN
jgi:predicted nucleic acid-binding protein